MKNEFYSCLLLFHSEKSFGWKLEDIYPKQENFSWLPYLGKRKNHENNKFVKIMKKEKNRKLFIKKCAKSHLVVIQRCKMDQEDK